MDKMINLYVLNVCVLGYINYTSTKRFKMPIFKSYNLGKNTEFKIPCNDQVK